MKLIAIVCYTLAYVGLSFLLSVRTAHADPVPSSTQNIAFVRARLQTAVNLAMPALQCRPGTPTSVINIGESTRVIACGSLPGFDAALVQGLGSVLAELNVARPRQETLTTAILFAEYFESLTAARRAAPVEMTFSGERIVASVRR